MRGPHPPSDDLIKYRTSRWSLFTLSLHAFGLINLTAAAMVPEHTEDSPNRPDSADFWISIELETVINTCTKKTSLWELDETKKNV